MRPLWAVYGEFGELEQLEVRVRARARLRVRLRLRLP